jgi:hypothetical protein
MPTAPNALQASRAGLPSSGSAYGERGEGTVIPMEGRKRI